MDRLQLDQPAVPEEEAEEEPQGVLPLRDDRDRVRLAAETCTKRSEGEGDVLVGVERAVLDHQRRIGHAALQEPVPHEGRCRDGLDVRRVEDTAGTEHVGVLTRTPGLEGPLAPEERVARRQPIDRADAAARHQKNAMHFLTSHLYPLAAHLKRRCRILAY